MKILLKKRALTIGISTAGFSLFGASLRPGIRNPPWFAGLLFMLVFLFSGAFSGEAAYYKYVDKNGVVHFTDRFESIPKEYRNQIQTIRERIKPEPAEKPPVKEEEATKRPEPDKGGPAAVSPPGKQMDEQAREAQEARERKERVRAEKIKRIDALREEIEARRKEIQELRTTWMVLDRNKLLRLNEEIGDLRKEIEVIQGELAEEE